MGAQQMGSPRQQAAAFQTWDPCYSSIGATDRLNSHRGRSVLQMASPVGAAAPGLCLEGVIPHPDGHNQVPGSWEAQDMQGGRGRQVPGHVERADAISVFPGAGITTLPKLPRSRGR